MADQADELTAKYVAAYAEGRFFDALNIVQGRMIDDALAWFAEGGVRFWRAPGEDTARISGLAGAATSAINDLGELATYKQRVAREALVALAVFRETMLRAPPKEKAQVANWLSEVALASAAEGSADGMMTMVRLGLLGETRGVRI